MKQAILSKEFEAEAIARLKSGESLIGKDGILTPLIKQIIEASLEGEIDAHLSESKATDGSNRRNGKTSKLLKTGTESFELETPQDRLGTFEPQIVKKRQTVLNESLDNKILSLYALGMSYEAIQDHLADMYGLEVSAAKISLISDKLMPVITEWRNRPLESVYPIVFLDAMHFKVRIEGKVSSRAFYSVLGINNQGRKEILGLYLSENEGSRFWLNVLEVFPKTEIQLCVIHQIRHPLKYVTSKDQKSFMTDLKLVYRANSKDLAEHRLLELDEKWGKKYPAVIKSWQTQWDKLSQYFKYPEELRHIIYTTNIIEGFHRQVRKYTKNKGAFTSENALLKLIYCAGQKILEKWYQPLHNWALIASQLQIFFNGRLKITVTLNLS